MRRVAAVGPAGDDAALGQWLARLSGIDSRVVPSLDELPWREVDLLWVHGVHSSHPALRPWLDAGGRLLATLDAAALPHTLGLEPAAPDDLRDSTWKDDGLPGPVGLAAFGPHPLFDGLPQGAHTWRPAEGERYRSATYASARPAHGRVVAVARRGELLEPRHVVAWEYAVGRGGILCLGSGVALGEPTGACPEQLGILLENALARDGIPAGERRPGARYWPSPTSRVVRRDLVTLPDLPGLGGELPDGKSALEVRSGAIEARDWLLAGRRGFLAGSVAEGIREAWIHPFEVASEFALLVDGAPPRPEALVETPVRVERRSRAGEVEVTERWSAALEHPVLWWDVGLEPGRSVRLEWSCSLRRAPPYPLGPVGDLELTIAPDGHAAAIRAVDDPFRLLVTVEGGTLEASPLSTAGIRFTLRASGPVRVRLSAGADGADWDRTAHLLAKRGLASLEGQRADHARERATYATSIETPEPSLDAAIEWAKARMDATLVGAPGVGRCAVADGGPTAFVAASALRMALAQLAIGDRGGPRDILKFFSLTALPSGRLLSECGTSGLGSVGDVSTIPPYLLLAARYAAWTAELDFLAHRWAAIRRALDIGMAAEMPPAARHCWREALGALQPLAEALGHPEVAEVLSGQVASLGPPDAEPSAPDWQWADPADPDAGAAALEIWRRLAPGVAAGTAARPAEASAALVRAAMLGVWGVRPNALEGGVRLAPWFPPAWEAMSLDRLRVGKSVLRVQLRRRFGQLAARVERVYGPRVHVEFVLRGAGAGTVLLDDVELQGTRVAFEAAGNHALAWPG